MDNTLGSRVVWPWPLLMWPENQMGSSTYWAQRLHQVWYWSNEGVKRYWADNTWSTDRPTVAKQYAPFFKGGIIIFSPWIWVWQNVFNLWHRHTKFWHLRVSPWNNMFCTFLTLVWHWPLTYMMVAEGNLSSLVSFTHCFYLVYPAKRQCII